MSLEFYPFKIKVNTAGSIFEVAVRINKHEIERDIAGAECYISFDSSYLRVVDEEGNDIVGIGTLPPLANQEFPQVLINLLDNDTGFIRYAAGTFEGKTAPCNLLKIRFRTLRRGQTNIVFQKNLCRVLIGLSKGQEIREVTPDIEYGFIDCLVGIETDPVSYYAGVGPFNPEKGEKFKVVYSYTSQITGVVLKIYTLKGRLLRTVISSDITSGFIEWDGKDESGNFVRNGVYVYQLILITPGGKIYQKPKIVGVLR